ncbi:chorismate synthase [bacterium]|nr:chorismate synthase [bacterium]
MDKISNQFGNRFKISTFGESHSKAIGVLIDGVQPNIIFDEDLIKKLLKERKTALSKYTSSRVEADDIEILSGVFDGKTIGTPIVAIIRNIGHNSSDYDSLKNVFRPSHADYTFFKKYGIRDYRGGGRASARETAARVIPGALAIKLLEEREIKIDSKVIRIGELFCKTGLIFDFEVDSYLKNLNGDSIGCIIETTISGVSAGVGDPVFEKLNGILSKAIFSIPAVKGVEFGDGFMFGFQKGSQSNDEMDKNGFLSNHAGGINGGVSNGNDIIIKIAFRGASSIPFEQKTVDIFNNEINIKIGGRHDSFFGFRVIPVINSMCAITLWDAILDQNKIGLEFNSIEKNVDNFVDNSKKFYSNRLKQLREEILDCDIDIFQTISYRFEIAKKISDIKKEYKLDVTDSKRESYLKNIVKELNLEEISDIFIDDFYELIFKYSKMIQKNSMESL